jgi:protocatechuate 3,4-dioxygenase beta subunit
MSIHPPMLSPGYKSTILRAPQQEPILLPHTLTVLTGPVLGEGPVAAQDADLTLASGGEAQGQRIVVHGQVRDDAGRPVPHTLVEVWQANAAGRYRHKWDRHDAPLDPHFTGVGRAMTDAAGRYRFVTVKPGAYPWGNHPNAWRPAHIHFSLFGRAFTQRLVTQMYFPDDPLFAYDPIFRSVPDEKARQRLVAGFDLSATVEAWALGFRFDIVLTGDAATPMETR